MKNLINKLAKTFSNKEKHIVFLTVDDLQISGAVYVKELSNNNKYLVCTSNVDIYISENNKINLALSIAKCIDELEEKAKFRIKTIVLNLYGINSKSIIYELEINKVKSINVNNLDKYINATEIAYYLGKDYFLTNLVPIKISLVKDRNNTEENNTDEHNESVSNKNSVIKFLIAGFKLQYIKELLDVFYNLSIELDNILFAPLSLPMALDLKTEDNVSVMYISNNYSIIYNEENCIDFVNFGTNFILEDIAKYTKIPYNVLEKNNFVIKRLILNKEQPLLFNIDNFFVNNIKSVINKSIDNYVKELTNLISSKNLINNIIIISNYLKLLQDNDLLIDMELNKINISYIHNINKMLTHSFSGAEMLNQAVAKYFFKYKKQDLALKDFKKRIARILRFL